MVVLLETTSVGDSMAKEAKITAEVLHYLAKKGKQFTPALCPDFIRRGKLGRCFDNCILNAIQQEGKLKYVEGIGRDVRTGDWIMHAWLTDETETYAYDPTWFARRKSDNVEFPFPTDYLGIVMDTSLVAKFMVTTEYCGVLANYKRDLKIAREILGSDII